MMLTQDLRYAFRQLRRNPGFALTAILTLALGIGATTAVFSVVEQMLMTKLPYRDADRIVALRTYFADEQHLNPHVTGGDYQDMQASSTLCRDHDLLRHSEQGVQLPDHATFTPVIAVISPQFADVFGVRPISGALFRKDDASHQALAGQRRPLPMQSWAAASNAAVGKIRQRGGRVLRRSPA